MEIEARDWDRRSLLSEPPTSDEIRDNRVIQLLNGTGEVAMACWYPQMGGYVGKCWITGGCWSDARGRPSSDIPGFDAYVFHDGAFPFGPDTTSREAIVIHHCGADQFIKFGRLAEDFLAKTVTLKEPWARTTIGDVAQALKRYDAGEDAAGPVGPIGAGRVLAQVVRAYLEDEQVADV